MGNSFDSFFSEENLSEVWQYMREYAGEAGREATKVALELFFVMKSPETSMIDKGIIVAALAMLILPLMGIPCLYVSGNGIKTAHAWNIAFDRKTNQWVHLDFTHGIFTSDFLPSTINEGERELFCESL